DSHSKDSIQSLRGEARAEKLTKEELTAIAENAAEARWSKSTDRQHYPISICGSPEKPLRIGDLEIPCYVLDDGRRVITHTGMVSALAMKRGGATKGGGDRISNFLGTKALKPY